MEEVLKKIYVKLVFLYRKHFEKDTLINQIEKEIEEEKKKVETEYKEKKKELIKKREMKLLANHIDFNLNSYRLIRYKNKHLGQRCFIIGNGPSLRAKDLEKLKDKYTFACNKIYKIFPETNWRPTYYFVEDSLVYKNNFREIRRISCPKFVSDLALNRERLPLVKKGIKFFDYIYYWDTFPEYPPLTVDFTQEVWCAYNVGYQMLNAAIYMGFKEIYLLGMDFSYDFSDAKPIKRKTKSGEIHTVYIMPKKDRNHFGKDYWEPGEINHDTDTKYALKAFEMLERESDSLGIKILNATRGGKLEVFKRVKLEDVI